MESKDWLIIGISIGIPLVVGIPTIIYVIRQHKESLVVASKDDIVEFINLLIKPVLKWISSLVRYYEERHFDFDFLGYDHYDSGHKGWAFEHDSKGLIGRTLNQEEQESLRISPKGVSTQVYRYPDPNLGVHLQRHYYFPSPQIPLRWNDLKEKHSKILKRIDEYDNEIPLFKSELRSLAAIISCVMQTEMDKFNDNLLPASAINDNGRFRSYITEIVFNKLLLDPQGFSKYLAWFGRDSGTEEAKRFWVDNQAILLAAVQIDSILTKTRFIQDTSDKLARDLGKVCSDLEKIKERYRKKYHIPLSMLDEVRNPIMPVVFKG